METERIQKRGIAAVVAIGAIVATMCDASQVLSGTIAYGRGFSVGQPWWVMPQFAAGFLVMALGYIALASGLSGVVATAESRSPGDARPFLVSLVAFVVVYLVSGFASDRPMMLSLVFYGAFVARWLTTYERGWLALLAMLMVAGGMAAEGLLVHDGLATYREADVFGVPLWLGGLYAHGAFALRESMRCFVYLPAGQSRPVSAAGHGRG